jgi:hypothetical protein
VRYIIDASYVDGYQLKLHFDNNEIRIVDLLPHLDGAVFEPLRDIAYFKMFKVNPDIDTITWPNDADFSPDFLYEIGIRIHEPDRSAETAGRRG